MKAAIPPHFRLLFLVLALCIAGCAGQTARYREMLDAGQADDAAELMKNGAEGSDILETLHYAYALRCGSHYMESTKAFDRAEALFKAAQEDQTLHEANKFLSAAFINETITPYTGNLHEFTLVNAYKGINFLFEGRHDFARVEFNRALERQRRAKEYFNEELQEEIARIKEAEKPRSQNQSISALDVARSPGMSQALQQYYSNMDSFAVFADYTNPFVTYLSGVFFLLEKDYKKAADILKEAAAMCPDHSAVQADFSDAQAAVRKGKKQPQKFVWVFFENGTGPGLEPIGFTIPLFIATNRVLAAPVALPRPTPGVLAVQNLYVSTEQDSADTRPVADMTQVAYTEFKSRFNTIILRAVVSTLTKAGMQAACAELGGDAGGLTQLAVALYSVLVTHADTRHWVSIPARFEAARIRIDNTNGVITLLTPGGMERTIEVDPTKNHMIFVQLRTSTAQPYIDHVAFD